MSASPPPLPTLSRYEQYKAGTATLVSFLVTTASSCGYGDPNNIPVGPVPVAKLSKCAEAIARRIPPVHIPGHIVDLVEEVIQGRQLYADMYAGFEGGKKTGKPANERLEGHLHFISVLKEVRDMLRETRKKFKANSPVKKKGPRKVTVEDEQDTEATNSMRSLFQHLEIEEPAPLSHNGLVRKTIEEIETPKATVKLDPIEERRFVLLCWLRDMLEIRKYIRQIWEDYANGELSLDCVTSATEIAFGIMRRSEDEELCKSMHELGLDDWLPLFATMEGELLEVAIAADRNDAHLMTELDRRMDLLCVEGGNIVSVIIPELDRFAAARKYRETYRPLPSSIEFGEKDPFGKVLFDLVPHFHGQGSNTDELRSQLLPRQGCHWASLSLVVLSQSYRDIYDILGDPSELVAPQLLDVTQRTIEELCQHRSAVSNDTGVAIWEPDNSLLASLKRDQERRIMPIQPGFSERVSKAVLSESAILKALPVGTGLELREKKYIRTIRTAAIANDGWAILGLAYLYRAARHHKLLDIIWEDLEWFVKLQSRQRPLVLDVPPNASDPYAFANHFGLGTFGYQHYKPLASNMNPPVPSQKVARRIEAQLEFPKLGFEYVQRGQALGLQHFETARPVLQKLAEKQYGDKARNQFTSLQLIKAYQTSYMQDEPELNFSYLGFATSCILLLSEIDKMVHLRLPTNFIPQWSEQAKVRCVSTVLWEVGDFNVHGKDLHVSKLALVARMLEKHIKSEGDKYVKESKAKCSGSLAEENKPKLERTEAHEDEDSTKNQEPGQPGGEVIGSAA